MLARAVLALALVAAATPGVTAHPQIGQQGATLNYGTLASGRAYPTTVSAVNACGGAQQFAISVENAPWFRVTGSTTVSVAPGQTETSAAVVDLTQTTWGTYNGTITVRCVTCGTLCTQDVTVISIQVNVITGVPFVDFTLDLLGEIARLQLQNPDLATTLVGVTNTEVQSLLGDNGITVDNYASQMISVGQAEPLFFFAALGEDPAAIAAAQGVDTSFRLPAIPPFEMVGPVVNTLILFSPATRPRPDESTMLLAGLSPPKMPPPAALPINRTLAKYDVAPTRWSPADSVEHELCLDFDVAPVEVDRYSVSLVYADGAIERSEDRIAAGDLAPCTVAGGARFAATRVQQSTRDDPEPEMLLAAGFLIDRRGALSNTIVVPVLADGRR